MDALKLIAADSVKEQAPEFNVGDTIRIDVKEFSSSKAQLLPARVPV